jgi:stalled ribosome rescue protein Dom34
MSTFHALVWIDHKESHVLMFDREHVESQRIHSRSHHKHSGKADDHAAYFTEVVQALQGSHEVLLTGPGKARTEFLAWCKHHHSDTAQRIVDNIAADHPTDKQLVALARQYFKKFDNMAADPSQL